MELLSDRIGIILKYGKVMGGLTKRYFFIDNKGILYYSEKIDPISNLLKLTSYDNDQIISSLINVSKTIILTDCSISGVKTYLENKFELQGRSYFELFLNSRDYRSILIFSWKEEFISTLREYVGIFREVQEGENEHIIEEKELQNFETENSVFKPSNNNLNEFLMPIKNNEIEKNSNNIFLNAKNKNYMDNIILKLNGKFVNQKDWDKDCIKVINPTSTEEEYEETWVELENGSNYSGPVKNGMPHGYGKEYRPDGSLYTGYFYKGKWHGVGTLTNETLDSYLGEFIDGCICGI